MGTNFYIKDTQTGEEIHIGKRSGGWAFALRTYRDDGLCYLHDWEQRLYLATQDPFEKIVDEYGNEFDCFQMLDIIDNPKWDISQEREHELDDKGWGFSVNARCGTYDLVEGEFS
jgi:hypothetical protein